ncbi:MAG: 50S ribosomal protein L25/general stress protein Ctc [Actinomycetales bacterium]|nr:50S ribosomal protein L25/general stress protein Ctc [Actinomycetales bacterium]
MADDNKLSAEKRTEFGKGAARRIRAAHKIPAVIYGHGADPQHVTLPGHETSLLLRKANALLTLDIEGAEQLALVKDVQKDPVRQLIEHIDLVVVRRGEKVTVDVPVHVEGESAPGTIVGTDHTALTLEVEATHIPERLTVSVEGLEEGVRIHAGDVELPAGATLVTDAEALVVAINTPAAPVEDDAAEGEESAEAEAGDAAEESAESGEGSSEE